MPWSIEQRDGKYCVVKKGETSPVPGGCHASRADAIKHQRALYANEPSAMTASVSGVDKPLAEWFEQPEPDGPQPLTVHEDGRVTGHLALWNQCHTSFGNECLAPPRSPTDYAAFHVGSVETAEGKDIPVGKIVYATKHASLESPVTAASRHYDDTGKTGAFVRAKDGQHGIWLSGVLNPDISDDGVRHLKANPPSGDWRKINHALELVAALAVAVPGYPIPRTHAMVASGGEDVEVDALIIGGLDVEPRSREYLRQRSMISSSLED